MDLFCLKAWYGSHFAFPSMRLTALAAKLRVFRLEDGDFLARKADLLEGIAFGEHRCAEWREWYWSCLSMVLCDSSQEASALGVSSRAVDTRIQSMHPSATASVRRKLYQKTAYAMLLPVQSDNPENRMRHKLTRLNLSDPIGNVTRRALRRLSNAFRLTTPRVAIILFRSLWNGWCTARRFQEEGSCVFGCPGEAQDSIEHYAFCPVQVSFARDRLHIPAQHTAAVQSFLVLGHNLDDTLQTMLLLNLYCCYSARNAIKNHVEPRAQQNLHECMLQFAHQGTFGHSASQRVLASSGARKFGRPAAATAPGRGRNTFVSGGRLVTGSEWR